MFCHIYISILRVFSCYNFAIFIWSFYLKLMLKCIKNRHFYYRLYIDLFAITINSNKIFKHYKLFKKNTQLLYYVVGFVCTPALSRSLRVYNFNSTINGNVLILQCEGDGQSVCQQILIKMFSIHINT